MTDDLEELLGPTAEPTNPELQEAIHRRTTRLIRRRAWLRRGKHVVLAACLVAFGAVVGWYARPGKPPLPPRTEFVAVPVPVLVPAANRPAPGVEAVEYVSAEQLEVKAELASEPADAAKFYRLAGDRYLTNEPGQAARCYQLFLIHAAPEEQAVSTADSWLLMSLKSSHAKEQNRVRKQGL